MVTTTLKLKQASAVLGVQPKELQNLVQFRVLKPEQVEGNYLFDRRTLLTAKVAFCLKQTLGARTDVLARFVEAFRASEARFSPNKPEYMVFICQLTKTGPPLKLGVPLRALDEQLQQGMKRVELCRDLPRGRKRPGWKKEFLSEAAMDIGDISEEKILQVVRSSRRARRMPEISVAAEG